MGFSISSSFSVAIRSRDPTTNQVFPCLSTQDLVGEVGYRGDRRSAPIRELGNRGLCSVFQDT